MPRCDTYDFGECTWGACEAAPWCPEHLGNGGQWAAAARALGYTVTMTPTVGAIVCYAPSAAYSRYGHVALVMAVYADGSFEVKEMNYVAFDEYDDRRSSAYEVLGFILPPGVSPGQGGGMGGGPSGAGTAGTSAQWENLRNQLNNAVPGQINRLSQVKAGLAQLGGEE